jgi:RHS repeat-associated protein
LHQDQQGSTRMLTDGEGNVVGRYNYDAWGNVTSHTGSAATNLQYDGQYADAETDYLYLRARFYDPKTGQFTTVDPAKVTTKTVYVYGNDNPPNFTDPLGMWSFSACFGICIGYQTGQGWGGGFGLGGSVQVGHVQVGTIGTSTIAYPHTGQLSWSVGVPGVGGEIDAQPGRIVGGQVCVGKSVVSVCGSSGKNKSGGSNSNDNGPRSYVPDGPVPITSDPSLNPCTFGPFPFTDL